ncbi:unnamed protein product, partial [Ixodes hexagonus]
MAAPRSGQVLHSGQAPIEILQWKIRSGSRISHGTGLLLYRRLNGGLSAAPLKLKSAYDGTVRTLVAKEGCVVQPGEVLLELAECSHPVVMKDLCAECGADLRQLGDLTPASVSMVHNVPELRVSQEVPAIFPRKEHFLLSLSFREDLVHFRHSRAQTGSNESLHPGKVKQVVHHFQLYGPHSPWYHTRVRPGTHHFLQQVSELYELHICTFGARPYAHAIASLLDPEGRFFSHRILSRDECFNPCSKTGNLRALFPCGDSMVCIIDDREDVWSYAPNLVAVKPYLFFKDTGDINAPPTSQPSRSSESAPEAVPQKVAPVNNGDAGRAEESPAEELGESMGHESKASPIELGEADGSPTGAGLAERKEGPVDKVKDDDLPEEQRIGEETVGSGECEGGAESGKHEPGDDGSEEGQREGGGSPKLGRESDDPSGGPVGASEGDVSHLEDSDDYLLYLEEILRTIHEAYYALHDQMGPAGAQRIPDLKHVVPYVRRKVLKGAHLVFSGLVPTNQA